MATEIVVFEPINNGGGTSNNSASTSNRKGYTSRNTTDFARQRSLTSGLEYVAEAFDSEKLPVTLVSDIQRFLRVANLIELEEPRVAYLCRFHAFEVAHNLDRNSSGRGVRQFKTSLLQRLEQDEEVTIRKRKEKSDIRELRRVYRQFKDFIIKHGGEVHLDNRAKLINARAIASVLYEVLSTVTNAATSQALADAESVNAKSEIYVPYNILPLDQGGIHQAIMQLAEVKVAVASIRNVRGLPFLNDLKRRAVCVDLFDWLQFVFGFQKGNVSNQREHLLLLLANTHVRQVNKQSLALKIWDGAVDELMKKFFKNYTDWCKFLGRKSNIRLPYLKQEAQQYKLLYVGLYLLIWGEAANIRFMPECLCYIFHHMAYEMHSVLIGAISMTSGEKVMPAYGGGSESFLNNVVYPIYNVIYEEAMKNTKGTTDHSTWRNYDDLNEFFWSPDCFEIGWPMRLDHDFFFVNMPIDPKNRKPSMSVVSGEGMKTGDDEDEEIGDPKEKVREQIWLGKTNFVEMRSFWHIFRSFDRMWSFLILSLQAMIIMACHNLNNPLQVFEAAVLEDIMSVFITSSVLELIQSVLDIAFTWKARRNMKTSEITRNVLKVIISIIWTITLPICYVHSRGKYNCYSTQNQSWLGEWCYSSYVVAVSIYLLTNAVDMVLFFVPVVGKYIETSNTRICALLSWWAQPKLYVGRGMQESQISVFKYTFFWFLLLLSKLTFSYLFEIKPLISPTKKIIRTGVKNYDWHELFPTVKSNAGAIAAIWAPIILVYFMDAQIWYSIYCAIFGGVYGILNHLGEIRTLGMLRSRFRSLPSAFNSSLIPPRSKHNTEGTNQWFFHWFQKASENEKNNIAKFVVVWNQIIHGFREEDLISNREMDLMKMPLSSELLSGQIQWPVFLLANKLTTSLSIARDFMGTDASLLRRIKKDDFMYLVVIECYDLLKYIFEILLVGDLEQRVVFGVLDEIEESIEQSTLLVDFNLSELPSLHAKCVDLVELLVEGNEDNYSRVVKALQDIFEVATTDLMTHGSRTLDSLYSQQQLEENTYTLFSQLEPQLFASKHSIHFPLPDSGPVMEKISRFHLLITVKDRALDVPSNLEARRRISFFSTSLFMDIPRAPKVRNMLSFSVLTPHYMEEVKYSTKELHSSKAGASISFYMQKIYPDEWDNFLERTATQKLRDFDEDINEENLRDWTSFRGQTLSRTVRGMMYYRKALKLQAFLDMAEDDDILQGYDAIERKNDTLSAQLEALADMKFTHVVSCQMFGSQKATGDPQALDILDLMIRYVTMYPIYGEGLKIY
ncbi:hypothetical protein LIER_23880 [Lithospermum erythrorhizon]|uniref:1,3-beta-glucan synthase n=1 Tax=Lithospermum erythrorhizon TaxID=34254 RepID=A0AAV3R4R8_LITER